MLVKLSLMLLKCASHGSVPKFVTKDPSSSFCLLPGFLLINILALRFEGPGTQGNYNEHCYIGAFWQNIKLFQWESLSYGSCFTNLPMVIYPLIPALRKQSYVDLCESEANFSMFQASQGYKPIYRNLVLKRRIDWVTIILANYSGKPFILHSGWHD